jgi:hypothetical protein
MGNASAWRAAFAASGLASGMRLDVRVSQQQKRVDGQSVFGRVVREHQRAYAAHTSCLARLELYINLASNLPVEGEASVHRYRLAYFRIAHVVMLMAAGCS